MIYKGYIISWYINQMFIRLQVLKYFGGITIELSNFFCRNLKLSLKPIGQKITFVHMTLDFFTLVLDFYNL